MFKIFRTSLLIALVLGSATPLIAGHKKNSQDRAMLEKMEAVPCGAKQKGITGLGSLWASAGITHVNTDEKLCPQYLVRSDEMEYHIRPTDTKHPVVLPVGQEIVFKIKKDRMYVKVADGDQKTRTYKVVAMEPTNAENAESASDRPADNK